MSNRVNKYTYLHVLQGDYGQGWEDLTASTDRLEVWHDKRTYQDEEGGTYRVIQRRELNKVER